MRAPRSLRPWIAAALTGSIVVTVASGCGGTTGRETDGIDDIPGLERPDATAVVVTSAEAGADARKPRDAGEGGAASRDAGGADAGAGGTVCGNGVKEGKEECDDGNALDGDGCSSFCTDTKSCDACLKVNCAAPDYVFPPCSKNVDGNAVDGPSAGDPKAALCRAVYACVLRTKCAVASLTDCYCGTAAGAACLTPRAANGACKKEIESGLESTEPSAIATSFADPGFGGGVALLLLQCAQDSCATECRHP